MAHFVTGRHFTVVTDQRSVSFMCSGENRGKIKNDEVLRWRMELHEFDFDIVYRSGKLNSAPDALSRVYCANMNGTTLHDIHASLCHPGIPHLHHFVRAKNLPYSVEDVRQTVRDCSVCSELKPNFYKPPATHLVKAIQPFERLSLYFKGSLLSSTKNRYMLTVIDEFSRFPLAFLCSSVDATWLSSPGPIFLRRHARSKYKPLVEEVDLVHATRNYARVRLSTGRETTVPLRDIAPMKRAPAPLFDATNQRDVALSGGSSLEPENLSSDHAISADDQQATCQDTSDKFVKGRKDRVHCRVKTFHTIRHRALTTLYVLSLLSNQHHLVQAPMDYGDRHVKGNQSTTMGLFSIIDVITLYARNVSVYVVRCLFVHVY